MIISCSNGKYVDNIYVDEDIIETCEYYDIDYYNLLKMSIRKKTSAIRQFALIDKFQGENFYSHGEYLMELIERIGDDTFVSAIKGISKDEALLIELYLKAGVDANESKYIAKNGNSDSKSSSPLCKYMERHPKIFNAIYNAEKSESVQKTNIQEK